METRDDEWALWRRPRERHVAAALIAIAVSFGLHFSIIRYAARFPVGRLAEIDVQSRFPSIHMQEVRRETPELPSHSDRFKAEDPSLRADPTAEAEALAEALQLSPPEVPEIPEVAMAGQNLPLIPQEDVPDCQGWEPRQELMQIEERLFDDKVSVSPRRFSDDIPRAARAPDISLPSEPAEDRSARLASVAGLPQGFGGNVQLVQFAGGGGVELPGSEFLPEVATLGDESAVLDEPREAVTDLIPSDRLLALNVAQFLPPDEEGFRYFKMELTRQGDEGLPVLPKDVLFIQDCSESMTQPMLNNCKEGIADWLKLLNAEDRFEIISFRDESERCFGNWTQVSAASRSRAAWYVEEMTARGKTDVYGSLREVLSLPRDQERPLVAILATDGRPTTGLVDSSDIIEQFTVANKDRLSMFCVAGGQRVNRFLLEFLGYRNRGDSMIVANRRDIPKAISELGEAVNRPVLANLNYRFTGQALVDAYPRTLTHLYLDRPLVVYGRIRRDVNAVAVQVIGNAGSKRHDMVFELTWDEADAGAEEIRGQWAWHRIYYLMGEHVRTGREETMAEIRGLADRNGLVVPYLGDVRMW